MRSVHQAPNGQINYRKGMLYARARPRGYQARKGGPPLLFATDIRMSILVTLAQAGGPMRSAALWSHIGRKYVGCVTELDYRGLVSKWTKGPREVYVALNALHPAAVELRQLLLKIAYIYEFAPPKVTDVASDIEMPYKAWEHRNLRCTFGDLFRTLPLLVLHVLGEAGIVEIARAVPTMSHCGVGQILWMYRAFGVLKGESRGKLVRFRFNREHALTRDIEAVLAVLDRTNPQWRLVAEHNRSTSPLPKHENRSGRKWKRWKW